MNRHPNYVPIAIAGMAVMLTLTIGFGKITEYRQELIDSKRELLTVRDELDSKINARTISRSGKAVDIREEYFKMNANISDPDNESWEMKRIPRPESEQVIFRRN